MRNLLLFLLVLVGVFWVRRALRRRSGDAPGSTPAQDASPPAGAGERMLPCAHCGLHVPESEGVRADGEFFCCEEHQRLSGRA